MAAILRGYCLSAELSATHGRRLHVAAAMPTYDSAPFSSSSVSFHGSRSAIYSSLVPAAPLVPISSTPPRSEELFRSHGRFDYLAVGCSGNGYDGAGTAGGNGGAGGGGGDDGRWQEEGPGGEEGKSNRSEAFLVLSQGGRSLESIPKDLAAAIQEGRIPGSIVERFFELEKSPLLRWLLQFGGFKERLLADDLFLAKVMMECGVGIFTKVVLLPLGLLQFMSSLLVFACLPTWFWIDLFPHVIRGQKDEVLLCVHGTSLLLLPRLRRKHLTI